MQLEEYMPSKLPFVPAQNNFHTDNLTWSAKQKLSSRKLAFDADALESTRLNLLSRLIKEDTYASPCELETQDFPERVPEVVEQPAALHCDTKSCVHHGQFCACREPKHPPTRLELPPTPPSLHLSSPPDCSLPYIPKRTSPTPPDGNQSDRSVEQLKNRQNILQEQLAQLKERLSAIQDTCMAKPSQTVAKTRERDVEEHLAARSRKKITGPVTTESQGAAPRRVLPTTTRSKRTSAVQPVKAQSTPRKFRSSVDKPATFAQFGLPAAYDEDSENMKASRKEIHQTNHMEDPERNLAELASKLQSSQAELDSRLMKLDANNELNERKEKEREELLQLANELRAMQTELKSQFVELQEYLRKKSPTKESDTGIAKLPEQSHPPVPLPSQPALGLGSLLPSLRQVMQHASETYTAPDSKTLFERDEQHATESSSVIAKAAAVLAVANQRRKNLESNMAALERAQQDRSMFNVLEQIGKDPNTIDRARIQAIVNEAISKKKETKKGLGSQQTVPYSRPSRPVRAVAIERERGVKDRRVTSPGRKNTLAELLTEYSGDVVQIRPGSPVSKSNVPRSQTILVARRPAASRPVVEPKVSRQRVLVDVEESAETPRRVPTKSVHFERKAISPKQPTSEESTMSIGLVPLGRYQYSAVPPQTKESTVPSQQSEAKNVHTAPEVSSKCAQTDIPSVHAVQTSTPTKKVPDPFHVDPKFVFESGTGLEYESRFPPKPVQPPPPAPQPLSRREEDVFTRIILQLASQIEKPTPTTYTPRPPVLPPSEQQLRRMVETALLEHIDPMLQPISSVRSPVPSSSLTPAPSLRPTKSTESEAEVGQTRLSSPGQQPTGPHPLRVTYDVAVGPSIQEQLAEEDRMQGVSTLHDIDDVSSHNGIPTPTPTMPEQSGGTLTKASDRVRARPEVHSVQTSPIHLPPASQSSSPLQSASTESLDITPLAADLPQIQSQAESTGQSEVFSLTLPNTFSDGVWLVDRSEGEAPLQVTSEAMQMLAGHLESNLVVQRSQSLASETEPESDTSALLRHQRSDGEIPTSGPLLKRGLRSCDPLTNPLLHLMALRQSSGFDISKLSERDRKVVMKTNALMKRQGKKPRTVQSPENSYGQASIQPAESSPGLVKPVTMIDASEGDDGGESKMLEWLQSLAGSPAHRTVQSSHKSPPSKPSTNRTDPNKVSMLNGVEMVQSDDSDATEADVAEEEAYEDDYEPESKGNCSSPKSHKSADGPKDRPLTSGSSPPVWAREKVPDHMRHAVTLSDDSDDAN